MTMSAVRSESSIKKDVLMEFPPEDEARSTRVAPLPQSDPLLEFSVEQDRTPVGPVRTDRRRHKSPSWASRAWRALRLRSRASGESSRLQTSPMTMSGISASATETDALMAFLSEDEASSIR